MATTRRSIPAVWLTWILSFSKPFLLNLAIAIMEKLMGVLVTALGGSIALPLREIAVEKIALAEKKTSLETGGEKIGFAAWSTVEQVLPKKAARATTITVEHDMEGKVHEELTAAAHALIPLVYYQELKKKLESKGAD